MSRKKSNTPKSPLRPCREVIQQLQWDPRFNLSAFSVHYDERFAGMRDAPLSDFLHKSEIPWHRIRRISTQDEIVWDRDERIDHVEQHASTPDATQPTLEALHTEPTNHSALALIPPQSAWPQIQAIRQEYDPSFMRWMPHINVLYGFLPDNHFADAARLIQSAIQRHEIKPFTITFDTIQAFAHRRSSTLWLQPDTPDTTGQPIHDLQAALLPHFPRCDEVCHKSDTGYNPHLSIAKIPKKSRTSAAEYQRTWQATWEPLRFQVERVYLISRGADTPFQVKHAVPLHGVSSQPYVVQDNHEATEGTPGPHQANSLSDSHAPPLLLFNTSVRVAWSVLVEEEGWGWLCEGVSHGDLCQNTLLYYGSHALCTALPESDLDLLCIVPEEVSTQSVFEKLITALQEHWPAMTWRIVDEAKHPALQVEEHGEHYEFTVAHLPLGLWGHPMAAWAPHLHAQPEAARRALQGPLDAALLWQWVQGHAQEVRFMTLLTMLRRWAHARGIDSATTGYFGGIAWAIIAAWWCGQKPITPHVDAGVGHEEEDENGPPPEPVQADMAALCQALLDWDWSTPLCIGDQTPQWQAHPKRDRMPVLTPSTPHINAARTATMSTQRVLIAEWQRALQLLQTNQDGDPKARWQALVAPIDSSEHPALLVWSIEAPNTAARAACEGWQKGQTIGFILHLESLLPPQNATALRPYPPRAEAPLLVGIGQPGTPLHPQVERAWKSAQAWLENRWSAWPSQPPGCHWSLTLTKRDNLSI